MTIKAYKAHNWSDQAYPLQPGNRRRDWIEDMNKWPRRCLPLTIANTFGWDLCSSIDVELTWHGDMNEQVQLSISNGPSECLSNHLTSGIVSWLVPWIIRTEKDWGIMVGPVPNLLRDGVTCHSGVIETSWFPSTYGITWMFTRPCSIKVSKGEPVGRIMPIRIKDLVGSSIDILPMEDGIHDLNYRDNPPNGNYYTGKGSGDHTHITSMRLKVNNFQDNA